MTDETFILTDSIENWEGRNLFYCKGSFLTGGSGMKPVIVTGLVVTAPLALLLAFYSKWIITKYSWTVILIALLLLILVFIFMLLATFSDPGLIKRNIIIGGKMHSNTIKVLHLGYIRKTKICQTCKITKPFRSAHCSDCDNCVERFDHHCPWLGNCIAKRNYRYFFLFIIFKNLLLFYIFSFAITQIAIYSQEYTNQLTTNSGLTTVNPLAEALGYSIVSLFIVIYLFIAAIFVTGLLFYHSYLICSNQTTKEELKKTYKSPVGNVNSRGCCRNIRIVLCSYLPVKSTLQEIAGNRDKILSLKRLNISDTIFKAKREGNNSAISLKNCGVEMNNTKCSDLRRENEALSERVKSMGSFRKERTDINSIGNEYKKRVCNTLELSSWPNNKSFNINATARVSSDSLIREREVKIQIKDSDGENNNQSESQSLGPTISIPIENTIATCQINIEENLPEKGRSVMK